MADQAREGTAPASSAVDPKLVGIGSWLVLPAIGFVLGPIIGVVGLGRFEHYGEIELPRQLKYVNQQLAGSR